MICCCLVTKMCPTLFCDPMDCRPPGTSVQRCSLNSCSNHFMMNVNQIIMLYVLSLHSDVCQLYLNKIGRLKKGEK